MGSTKRVMRVKLTVPESIADRPVLTQLPDKFNVATNMLRARFSSKGGWLEFQLTGAPTNIEKALAFLENEGVTVKKL